MIEKMIKDFIEKMIFEIKKEENQTKIEDELLNPLFIKYSNKLYPYLNILMYLYGLNLFLIILIIILIIMFNRKKIKILN
jgi:hypothetical protein